MGEEYVAAVVGSGNTRLSRIKKFLAKPPKAAVALVLVAAAEDGESQTPLGQWEIAECVPELAIQVVDLLEAHTAEVGGHVVAQLAFVNATGAVVAAVALKRQANHLLQDDAGGLSGVLEANNALTGDTRSQAVQAQQHLERMSKLHIAGLASVLVHSERIVQRQAEMLETLADRLGYAESRAERKERELDELVEALREQKGEGEEMSPAQERALKFIEALAPHVMAKLMAGPPAPKPKPPAVEGEHE